MWFAHRARLLSRRICRTSRGPARHAASRLRGERRELLRWQAALNPFDVKVHLLHLVVAHRLARGDAFLATVVLDGALERMQLAAPDVLFSAGDQFGDILRDGRGGAR